MKQLFLLLLCVGCVSPSMDQRSDALKQQLFCELKNVSTLDDVLMRQEELTTIFRHMAQLAIEAHKTKKSSPTGVETKAFSTQLEAEWKRVLAIPGAMACMEKCQESALNSLDGAIGTVQHQERARA